MMHDFEVSLEHTIIVDLPLSLDPRNSARSLPVIPYDSQGGSRFGIPKWNPAAVLCFETDPCCIFQVANCWDEFPIYHITNFHQPIAVNMLDCRLTSAAMVYGASSIAAPIPATSSNLHRGAEAIPFEFPSIVDSRSMKSCRYIFGCSLTRPSFGAALNHLLLHHRSVDARNASEILASTGPDNPIKIFKLP
ncbi:carotenoid oxygenase [Bisporella sp. PMI_857]|nr:carotenoid oxygenase [Bisporella sp. PMI_857]